MQEPRQLKFRFRLNLWLWPVAGIDWDEYALDFAEYERMQMGRPPVYLYADENEILELKSEREDAKRHVQHERKSDKEVKDEDDDSLQFNVWNVMIMMIRFVTRCY